MRPHSFRTPVGVIALLMTRTGDAQDYFVLGLQDGALYSKLNIKGQTFEKMLTIAGTYLHNNLWHSVKFARKVRNVNDRFVTNDIALDNIELLRYLILNFIQTKLNMLSSSM